MNYIKQIERIKRIHGLVKNGTTGTPKELARRLNISERNVFLLIERLREMDAPICYDRKGRTYYYSDEFDLQVSISIQVLKGDILHEIYAGSGNYNQFERLQGSCSVNGYI